MVLLHSCLNIFSYVYGSNLVKLYNFFKFCSSVERHNTNRNKICKSLAKNKIQKYLSVPDHQIPKSLILVFGFFKVATAFVGIKVAIIFI